MTKKPKGKTPSLISGSSGTPKKVAVQRKSQCHRCKLELEVGGDCYGIPCKSSGFSTLKRFCQICFQAILEETQKDLDQLKLL